MNVIIEPQERKSLSMVAVPGGIKVCIPCGLDPDDVIVHEFIGRGLKKLASVSVESKGEHSKDDVRRRVKYWAVKLGVEVRQIQIRDMKSKWGSFSSKGKLTLNNHSRYLPHSILDYLLVHELAHIKFPNHAKGFQLLMDMTLKDWRKREQELAAWMLQRMAP